jgi:hypothetical protein
VSFAGDHVVVRWLASPEKAKDYKRDHNDENDDSDYAEQDSESRFVCARLAVVREH